MKTSNAMQLKAQIKDYAKDKGVPAQLMMQNYLLERLLERIAFSKWRNHVVIKGGMLISSLIGVESRTTKDLDATIQGFVLTHKSAEAAFRDICSVQVDDDIAFEFVRTDAIRESDNYPGIRVFLKALYAPMSVPLSIDITTGDKITPEAIAYDYPLLFDNRSISVMAYPLETVLAEKLETVIARDVANTRPRDYYDIHMLWRLRGNTCDASTLARALVATSDNRGSAESLRNWNDVVSRVSSDTGMRALWLKYQKSNPYAADVSFEDACKTVSEMMEAVTGITS
jgi:predicted nucleotidyltransferase component of viral defense system